MADHPGAKQSTTGDRTGALVAGGLALLAVIGVATVFSETIAGAWSPTSSAPGTPETPISPPAVPSPATAPGSAAGGPDGGAANP
jgi:hypothetical protein